jgi:pimeloyl-ACP methyl ester carboxylesterase
VKANPVVIIPGLLGTELELSGWRVWDDTFHAVRVLLNPGLLLPWLNLKPVQLLTRNYGVLRTLLVTKGYVLDSDFFMFEYDWRVGIEQAAQQFARFFANRVFKGVQVTIIAHSLGCLIARWAIVKRLVEELKIKKVIAAGPPMAGAARAFRSVVDIPNISERFNRLLLLLRRRWPATADQITEPLTKSLMTMTSLLELLPPPGTPVFADPNQTLFDAFEWPGWPVELESMLDKAKRTQQDLQQLIWPGHIHTQLVLAENRGTDEGYLLDSTSPFVLLGTLPPGLGDGTVLADSARQFGGTEMTVKAEHDLLLTDPAFLNYIDGLL